MKYLFSVLLLSILSLSPALAQKVNVDAKGVALEGYDPVAFFTDKKPVKGVPAFTGSADGATYQFASAEHQAAFAADPKKYQPAYGGYCAYGVAGGYKVKVEIETWQIVDGKLYLNYDKGVQGKFNKDVPGYITKADANWVKIVDKKRKGLF